MNERVEGLFQGVIFCVRILVLAFLMGSVFLCHRGIDGP